jgi:hypothetical protein
MIALDLVLSATSPRVIFGRPATIEAARVIFQRLASQLHPDRNPDARASEAMAKLNVMFDEISRRFGVGATPVRFKIAKVDRTVDIVPRRTLDFELGKVLLGADEVLYHIRPEFADLVARFHSLLPFSFPDDKIRGEVAPYLPREMESYRLEDGSALVSVGVSKEAVKLSEVRGAVKDPKHVAWIVSDLYGLACYFHIKNITLAGLSVDAIWILPKAHRTLIVGGWWYSAANAQKLLALPPSTLAAMPKAWLDRPRPGTYVNCELIKAIGRELLGDVSGARLVALGVPKPMAAHLRSIGTGDTIIEYHNWTKVLTDSFGARRFTELDLMVGDVY